MNPFGSLIHGDYYRFPVSCDEELILVYTMNTPLLNEVLPHAVHTTIPFQLFIVPLSIPIFVCKPAEK